MEDNIKKNILIIGASSKLASEYIAKSDPASCNFFGISSKVQGVLSSPKINIYGYESVERISNTFFHKILIFASRLPSENIQLKEFIKTNNAIILIISSLTYLSSSEIIFLSTYSVYDPFELEINERSEIFPSNDYANSKILMENKLRDLAIKNNFSLLILRIPVLLYKGVQTNFLGNLVFAIKDKKVGHLANPDSKLSLVFDVDSIIRLANCSWKGIMLVNCSSKPDITFREISILAKKFGLKKVNWIETNRPSQNANLTKLTSILGNPPSAKYIVENWLKEEFLE